MGNLTNSDFEGTWVGGNQITQLRSFIAPFSCGRYDQQWNALWNVATDHADVCHSEAFFWLNFGVQKKTYALPHWGSLISAWLTAGGEPWQPEGILTAFSASKVLELNHFSLSRCLLYWWLLLSTEVCNHLAADAGAILFHFHCFFCKRSSCCVVKHCMRWEVMAWSFFMFSSLHVLLTPKCGFMVHDRASFSLRSTIPGWWFLWSSSCASAQTHHDGVLKACESAITTAYTTYLPCTKPFFGVV